MNLKVAAVAIPTIMVLAGILTGTFVTKTVKASGTILINADGSIDPPTANITSIDNVTYTFTADINDSIVVLRSNITIDGAGHVLNGTGTGKWTGITIESYYSVNVTVQNLTIVGFGVGIALVSTDYNKILGNIIVNNTYGIWVAETMNNTISGNNITNNTYGLHLNTIFYTTFYLNNITNNEYGIYVEGMHVHDNKFYHNNFINNTNQVYAEPDNPNVWDDGYPSGGNYWDDFPNRYPTVGDDYSGPNQDIPGSDGIWDGPYEIDANNTDRYPLTHVIPEFPTWTSITPMFIVLMVAIIVYKRSPKKQMH
jgi:parallel beta-helix repeat protein